MVISESAAPAWVTALIALKHAVPDVNPVSAITSDQHRPPPL